MKKPWLFPILCILCSWSALPAQTLDEGLKQLENENYTAALNTFSALASNEPANPIYQYYTGEARYLMEDYTGAEKAYSEGLKINSKCAECAIGLGKIKLDQNKSEEAQSLFEGAIKSNKKSASILALVGVAYLSGKKPSAPKAIEYLIKSRDMDPKVASTWTQLGDAYMLNEDLGNAMSTFEIAVEKDKNNLHAFMSMAKMWASTKQVDLAIQKLEGALALSPDYAPAYKSLYELYIRAGKMDKVTPLLSKYVSLVGDDVDARVRLVKFLCFQAKDYDKAISEGEKLLLTNPEQYTLHRWLAWSYGEKEQYQPSYDHSKKLFEACASDPSRKLFPSDNEFFAKAAFKTGKLDEAAIAYEKIIAETPAKAAEIYGNFAKSYFDAKNYNQAIAYYLKKGTVKNLNSAEIYYLGLSQFYTDNLAAADSSFEKVLAVNPNYPQGWYMRIRIANKLDTSTVNMVFLARPHHEKYIEYASLDTAKYKKNLIDSYNYMGYYFVQKEDYETAKTYYTKALELDPADNASLKAMEILNNAVLTKKKE